MALLVAELAANAVRHGRVAGREFRLRLALATDRRTIRIEVADACPQRPPSVLRAAGPDDESGRGLLLIGLLSTRWGSAARDPIGKTVWAEVATDT